MGYKCKNDVYKIFKWEEIIKVKIGEGYFAFYKADKLNRGKNIVEMKYHFTRKNEMATMENCRETHKFIISKQEKHNFKIQYTSERAEKLLNLDL